MVWKIIRYASGILFILVLLSFLAVGVFAKSELPASAFTKGYNIDNPVDYNLIVNEDYTFSFHVYNISNGIPIGNASTVCYFHLYNDSGDHINEQTIRTVDSHLDWEVYINSNNLTSKGDYSYKFSCNDSAKGLGGFVPVSFVVTERGQSLVTSHAIVYLTLIGFSLFIFIMVLFTAIVIPFRDVVNDRGKIISVNQLKLLKPAMWYLSYIILLFIVYIANGLARNYLYFEGLNNFLYWAYSILLALLFPITIIALLLWLILFIQSKRISKALESGVPI